MIRIVADEKIPFLKGALDDVAAISYMPGNKISYADVRNADGLIIRTRTKCKPELLAGSKVKFIASATIGYDHIDTDYCDKNEIYWTNSPGCNSASVEQYVVSALLELAVNKAYSLEGKTIGIIGVGNVGSKIAESSRLLGLIPLLNDPPRAREEGQEGFVSLDELMEKSDIISFHAPLNLSGEDKTYHMADDRFFEKLKSPIVLINASRGEVIDENALQKAIRSGKIHHSVLDVWENEPDISRDLLNLVSIATAHIAGYSTEGKVNGTLMAVHSASKYFQLGRDNWEPGKIPGPEQNQIVVDCTGLDKLEIIHNVYIQSYNIMEDDTLLREAPSSFESLRGGYRIRREAPHFNVRLNNNPYDDIPEILEKLGFSILELDCFC